MVKGTLESELRTKFWPSRFTYSPMRGSLTSLLEESTICEYCLPIATCLSRLIQLPKPRLQPTLRLPIADTSLRLPSVISFGTFSSLVVSLVVSLSLAKPPTLNKTAAMSASARYLRGVPHQLL